MKTTVRRRAGVIVAGCLAMLTMTASGVFAADDDEEQSEYHNRPGYGMGFGMHPGSGMHQGWGMHSGWGMGRGGTMRFLTIDQNGDGLINDDEAAANAEAVFTAMDADDSGDITEAEFMSVRMGPGERRNKARQEAMQKRKADRFPEMDTDQDKLVTLAEFLSAAQKRFAAADENKDGAVTPWEFRANRRIY